MDEQEKKVQRIMKCTVCLCGFLILLRAIRMKTDAYEQPELYVLHKSVAVMADFGQRMFLPAVAAEQNASFMETAAGAMAEFFGWAVRDGEELYVEDEYTRQELIEAGRGGTLSAIQKENGTDARPSEAAEHEEQDRQENAQESTQPAETTVPEADSTVQNEQEEEHADRSAGTDTEQSRAEKSGTEENSTAESSADEAEKTENVPAEGKDFKSYIAGQKKLSAKEILKQYFVVDPVTKIDMGLLSYDTLTQTEFSVKKQTEGPQIVIYHTHSQETFRDSVNGDPETAIVGVGTCLAGLLTEKGYQVLHLTDTFDVIGEKTDRSRAYTIARKKLKEVLEEYPSIQILLDIHRDGVPDDKRLVTTIDGRKTAKLMFFNGLSYKKAEGKLERLENPYIQENLALSFQTEYLCDIMYPGLSRCIYLKAYRYNLDLLPGSMLIEVGAQTNTVEEAKNAMLPLAEVLGNIL